MCEWLLIDIPGRIVGIFSYVSCIVENLYTRSDEIDLINLFEDFFLISSNLSEKMNYIERIDRILLDFFDQCNFSIIFF